MEWAEVLENPFLKNLPFKIELNKWGKVLMSPASNNHGRLQFNTGKKIDQKKGSGQTLTECSIQTPEGVKVADVAWASDEFIVKHGFETPYTAAPEICVEIISPSNTQGEMEEKITLYLAQGAHEVWLVDQEGKICYFSNKGEMQSSKELDSAEA